MLSEMEEVEVAQVPVLLHHTQAFGGVEVEVQKEKDGPRRISGNYRDYESCMEGKSTFYVEYRISSEGHRGHERS